MNKIEAINKLTEYQDSAIDRKCRIADKLASIQNEVLTHGATPSTSRRIKKQIMALESTNRRLEGIKSCLELVESCNDNEYTFEVRGWLENNLEVRQSTSVSCHRNYPRQTRTYGFSDVVIK
jgi:hypothetical protein